MGCGYGYPKANANVDKKLNEMEFQVESFPWTVIISKNETILGSGSLITPAFVLTAASILIDVESDNLYVHAGKWNITGITEKYFHQTHAVEAIIRHKHYDGGLDNNVALLMVALDFIFQPNIRTVCLPVLGATFDYSTCLTMAWTPESDTPHMSKFQIQPRSKCEERLPCAYLQPNSTLDESLMCAIDASEQKTFSLNSGAPLFCPMPSDPNRYTQAGIVIGSINRSNAISGLFHGIVFALLLRRNGNSVKL
ncbi:hypothetical protein AWZ03_010302 [Drosophila navojoa]|uniref:Peptidase S1 domain-containing protein n=1 Tax=Drosophila navojoa TaxID=7232 RepID=A0A484B375_DRONA|nr:hypothetical protein AWZ03_010302 [Drosophila navojoa]